MRDDFSGPATLQSLDGPDLAIGGCVYFSVGMALSPDGNALATINPYARPMGIVFSQRGCDAAMKKEISKLHFEVCRVKELKA